MSGEHYVIDCYYYESDKVTRPDGYFNDCPIIIAAMKRIGVDEDLNLGNARLTDYTLIYKYLLNSRQNKKSLAMMGNDKHIIIKYINTYIYIEDYYAVNIQIPSMPHIVRMRG